MCSIEAEQQMTKHRTLRYFTRTKMFSRRSFTTNKKSIEKTLDLNHLSTVPNNPNHKVRRSRSSTVSKAAERSRRQKEETCLEPMAFMRLSNRE
jgi:hypothetical protein